MDSFVLWSLLIAVSALFLGFLVHFLVIRPVLNPINKLPGPPSKGLFDGSHISMVMDPVRSPRTHEGFVKKYGRSIRIRGPVPWDERLFTLDPVSMTHVLKNSTIYEKPWQSRALISGLIGCGMLAAEGQMHKRQRRVGTPAFSIQNMRALVPLVFGKGLVLKDKWLSLIKEERPVAGEKSEKKLDVMDWISRATFDVIGFAGFDYQFNAVENGDNELFCAYKEMFEIGISQQSGGWFTLLSVYFPWLRDLVSTHESRTVAKCRETIYRVAGQLIQEKKQKLAEAEKDGKPYSGRDLLTLMLKSNAASDLPPEQRISDEDILNNINTFMFAGSDTTSISIVWTLLVLTLYPQIQTKLREECLSILPSAPLESLTQDEVESLYATISSLPYLDNVVKESLRLIPPVHSSVRAATQDDVIPTSTPIKREMADGTVYEDIESVRVRKGTWVHIPIEAFNMDKEIWGEDAWHFIPERWDNLPEAVKELPGLYCNTLTFSGGPRSCIGQRFSLIEMKSFLFILLTSFNFAASPDDKVGKANVVLTRPYVVGKQKEGSQCPLMVSPYVPEN